MLKKKKRGSPHSITPSIMSQNFPGVDKVGFQDGKSPADPWASHLEFACLPPFKGGNHRPPLAASPALITIGSLKAMDFYFICREERWAGIVEICLKTEGSWA